MIGWDLSLNKFTTEIGLRILCMYSIMPEINTVPFAAVSPEKVESAKQCVEETYRSLNRLPFFMTELDETDGAGGENIALEAIRALAYEGTAVEVAENFKEQGNNFAKEKAWKDARDCYDRALIALKAPDTTAEGIRSNDLGLETVAAQDENIEERNIEEKCLVNRALCNLELRMRTRDPTLEVCTYLL